MDILDILLDILLKPPQPFIGLFLIYTPDVAMVFPLKRNMSLIYVENAT